MTTGSEVGIRGGGSYNTHVFAHAGRILSFVEVALPIELDRNLETVGPVDFGGIDTAFTALGKIDSVTGELPADGEFSAFTNLASAAASSQPPHEKNAAGGENAAVGANSPDSVTPSSAGATTSDAGPARQRHSHWQLAGNPPQRTKPGIIVSPSRKDTRTVSDELLELLARDVVQSTSRRASRNR